MKRILLAALLLPVVASIYFGAHLYVAQRLVWEPGLPSPWAGVALLLLALLSLSPLADALAQRRLAPRWRRLVAWPTGVWMGFAFLLVVTLFASDLLLWLGGARASALDVEAGGGAGRAEAAAGVRALLVLAVSGAASGLALRGGLREPALRRVEVALPRWPAALDGYRIAQISDIHIGGILGRRFAAQLARRVNALEAELVAVTGDLVDGPTVRLADDVRPFASLRARDGVYFVTGNHDHYSGAEAWAEVARALGMRPLRNERVAIGAGQAAFDLVGVDDHRGGLLDDGGEDLPRALAGRDPARPALLLAHDPSTFRRASRAGIDLQLSGHTHGGQIWPFRYLVRLAVPYVAGLYREGRAQLYVSCGTGFWGPPMRLGAPAEITEITLRAAPGAAAPGGPDAEAV